jgi:hypothetical protein
MQQVDCRNISITLIDLNFGEEKAHGCAIASSQQLGKNRLRLLGSGVEPNLLARSCGL